MALEEGVTSFGMEFSVHGEVLASPLSVPSRHLRRACHSFHVAAFLAVRGFTTRSTARVQALSRAASDCPEVARAQNARARERGARASVSRAPRWKRVRVAPAAVPARDATTCRPAAQPYAWSGTILREPEKCSLCARLPRSVPVAHPDGGGNCAAWRRPGQAAHRADVPAGGDRPGQDRRGGGEGEGRAAREGAAMAPKCACMR
eukprot:366438-Chlamydomonas_euryale.AAC.11